VLDQHLDVYRNHLGDPVGAQPMMLTLASAVSIYPECE
jgi:hypothetical protein